MMVARFTIWLRCALSIPCVIVRNIGIVPSGLVRVKKDVKQINANGSNDDDIGGKLITL